jgi:hypothetical protein
VPGSWGCVIGTLALGTPQTNLYRSEGPIRGPIPQESALLGFKTDKLDRFGILRDLVVNQRSELFRCIALRLKPLTVELFLNVRGIQDLINRRVEPCNYVLFGTKL